MDISQVLAMPVAQALEFFAAGDRARCPAAHRILARLADVGLGYLGPSASRSRRCPAASGNG